MRVAILFVKKKRPCCYVVFPAGQRGIPSYHSSVHTIPTAVIGMIYACFVDHHQQLAGLLGVTTTATTATTTTAATSQRRVCLPGRLPAASRPSDMRNYAWPQACHRSGTNILALVLFPFFSAAILVETPNSVGKAAWDQCARRALPAAEYVLYPGSDYRGSGRGEIRSAWCHGGKMIATSQKNSFDPCS